VKTEILLFAGLRDEFQGSVLTVQVENLDLCVEELNALAREQFPGLENHLYKVAVNQAYVEADFQLLGGEEIAFIPAVSGG
jgi:molybdopterin converting factor small subunit